MPRFLIAIIFLGLSGCGGQSAPPKVPTKEHPSDGSHTSSKSDHAGHTGMAGMSEVVRPATLVMDAGTDHLKPGIGTTLKFHLERDGKTFHSFSLLHERIMHFIVVRDALDEFQHLHPQVAADGAATIELTFPTAGTYWLFVDCQPEGEAQQTVRHNLTIAGDAPASPELNPNVPSTATAGQSKAHIALQRSDGEWLLIFSHTNLAGEPLTDLEPYLGAMGHLVVIGAGTGEYVHAHAETQSAPDGKVSFAAHISRPGIYKAWGQFQQKGQVFTVPAVLKID